MWHTLKTVAVVAVCLLRWFLCRCWWLYEELFSSSNKIVHFHRIVRFSFHFKRLIVVMHKASFDAERTIFAQNHQFNNQTFECIKPFQFMFMFYIYFLTRKLAHATTWGYWIVLFMTFIAYLVKISKKSINKMFSLFYGRQRTWKVLHFFSWKPE